VEQVKERGHVGCKYQPYKGEAAQAVLSHIQTPHDMDTDMKLGFKVFPVGFGLALVLFLFSVIAPF
jgi:hypothetical protein